MQQRAGIFQSLRAHLSHPSLDKLMDVTCVQMFQAEKSKSAYTTRIRSKAESLRHLEPWITREKLKPEQIIPSIA